MSVSHPRQVYLLNPSQLTPETIAVTFAKTSRSPLTFREIADELSAGQSADFHEKWVVGYGHASVAEHAVLHVAFENVSRLAIECIESNRLSSYTEKSTRYQKWDAEGYYLPEEVIGSQLEGTYREACGALFEAYRGSLEPVKRVVQKSHPRKEGESDDRWDARIRSRYVDACRFLLPSASLANVGMTANARSLEHAICKMLAHPLAEVRAIGEQVKEVAEGEIPTLVKYAVAAPRTKAMEDDMRRRARELPERTEGDFLTLLAHDEEAEQRVLAAAIYAQSTSIFRDAMAHVQSLDPEGMRQLADVLLGGMDRFEVPPRAVEHAGYTFDALMDQGAYFEVKRHRIMTQTPQPLTTRLGYAVPRLITEAGFEQAYRNAMKTAQEAFENLAKWNPQVASYVVPNAFNRRLLMDLNLREAFHFCELRSAPNAHFSIRRVARRMAEMIAEVHPLLASYMRLPQGEDWRTIEKEHFTQV